MHSGAYDDVVCFQEQRLKMMHNTPAPRGCQSNMSKSNSNRYRDRNRNRNVSKLDPEPDFDSNFEKANTQPLLWCRLKCCRFEQKSLRLIIWQPVPRSHAVMPAQAGIQIQMKL
jgi:hypothetical protein